MDEPLLDILVALADPARLRIVGCLAARREMSVPELSAAASLPAAAVAHHIARLRDAALVEAVVRPGGVAYRLGVERLHEVARAAGAARAAAAGIGGSGQGDPGAGRPMDDARVLRAFIAEGRITTIPAQEKKRLVVLRYLAETVFTPERAYPEKEVNQLLALWHPDVASLRRYLVDFGFMSRDAGTYRLQPRLDWPP